MTEIQKLITELKIWMTHNSMMNPDEYMHEFDIRFLEIEKKLLEAFVNKELSEEEYILRTGVMDDIYNDVRKDMETQLPFDIQELMKRFGGRGGFFIIGGFK
jgi:hypothetical protein